MAMANTLSSGTGVGFASNKIEARGRVKIGSHLAPGVRSKELLCGVWGREGMSRYKTQATQAVKF